MELLRMKLPKFVKKSWKAIVGALAVVAVLIAAFFGMQPVTNSQVVDYAYFTFSAGNVSLNASAMGIYDNTTVDVYTNSTTKDIQMGAIYVLETNGTGVMNASLTRWTGTQATLANYTTMNASDGSWTNYSSYNGSSAIYGTSSSKYTMSKWALGVQYTHLPTGTYNLSLRVFGNATYNNNATDANMTVHIWNYTAAAWAFLGSTATKTNVTVSPIATIANGYLSSTSKGYEAYYLVIPKYDNSTLRVDDIALTAYYTKTAGNYTLNFTSSVTENLTVMVNGFNAAGAEITSNITMLNTKGPNYSSLEFTTIKGVSVNLSAGAAGTLVMKNYGATGTIATFNSSQYFAYPAFNTQPNSASNLPGNIIATSEPIFIPREYSNPQLIVQCSNVVQGVSSSYQVSFDNSTWYAGANTPATCDNNIQVINLNDSGTPSYVKYSVSPKGLTQQNSTTMVAWVRVTYSR
jgi:hypothetical protein